MVRHAAHGRALGRILNIAVARREREVELARGQARVVVEHLIEITRGNRDPAGGQDPGCRPGDRRGRQADL